MKRGQNEETSELKLSNKEIFDVFNPDINWRKAYCAYFQCVPNIKSISRINIYKVLKWFEDSYQSRILRKIKSELYNKKTNPSFEDIVFVLDNKCFVHMDFLTPCVEIFYSNESSEIDQLVKGIRSFRKRIGNSSISVITTSSQGLSLTSLNIKRPNCSIEKNYNDDLVKLHGHILASLKKSNSSGLSLFHGMPGTGKSTYIRYLITLVNKSVIILSPKLAGNLDDPNLTRLLVQNPDTIIVIEDAEDLLVSRDSNSNSAISMLLNLTDGLLGASLGIQFICTFNTNLNNIDKALLRKGRLTTLYEFKPLTQQKSQELLNDLGIYEFNTNQSMTLAEIYNCKGQEFEYTKAMRPLGFTSKVA